MKGPAQLARCEEGDTEARYFYFVLDNGIYFAASQCEAGFLTTHHMP